MEEIYNPLFEVLKSTFSKSALTDIETYYLSQTSDIKKWTCYSDYCFGDKCKPNDVVTFSIVPYIDEPDKLAKFINSIAKTDIKNTKSVKKEFTEFLKTYPVINFSFILNNKKNLFGKNNTEIKKSLEETFFLLKKQYILWIENQPENTENYKNIIKKLDCTINLIKNNKKIKQIIEMLLVTFLGSYVCSLIINNTKSEIFAWLSDRDSINEVCNHLSIDLFHNYLHGLSNAFDFKFVTASATSNDNPFYDDFLKIPDYIAGTLADYNFNTNGISKEKFDSILSNYMAENIHNNFVFDLKVLDDGNFSCSRINIHNILQNK